MFNLVTGLPGSCKTSTTLEKLREITDRPIFYHGIVLTDEGKKAFPNWTELTSDEVLEWHDHLPSRGVLVVDEAQKHFPVRASSKPVPASLKAIETHRHNAWDLYFITQAPNLIDSHARSLANEHYHYVRPYGAPFITEYHSGTGAVSPTNRSDLARCSQKRRGLAKSVWGLYVSADEHTHKFRPPKMIFIFLGLVVAAAFFWWYFFSNFSIGGVDPDAAPSVVQGDAVHRPSSGDSPQSSDWADLLQEQVRGVPFTAPLYREQAREVKSVPMVHGCMAFENDGSDCTCYTQQGTPIRTMAHKMCLRALHDGVFNHMVADGDLGYPSPGQRSGGGEERAAPRATASKTSL
ncbi:MAG: zonular occludens toxin domain-containing protein [Alloalcanivorax sp.]